MDEFLLAAILFLLANIAVGIVVLLRGEHPVDRLLAAQLSGTTGMAVCLLMAETQDMPAARNGALILSVLSALTAVAFVHRYWPQATEPPPGRGES